MYLNYYKLVFLLINFMYCLENDYKLVKIHCSYSNKIDLFP